MMLSEASISFTGRIIGVEARLGKIGQNKYLVDGVTARPEIDVVPRVRGATLTV